MPKFSSTSSALFFACAIALAMPAHADTLIGIQAISLSGTHFEPKEVVSGSGAAGFLHIDQRWRSVQLHLEGIPSVGTAIVNTNAGPARATIGMFGATARFRMDRAGHVWFGLGTQILAQRTPLAAVAKIDASRLAGSRYELFGDFPAGTNRFVESAFAVMPHLSGTVYETKTAPLYARYDISGAETAGMTDLSCAYGVRRGRFDYLFGGRAINFAAKFVDGRLADRNVGSGVFAEMRLHI